ncbi:hypothetical protein Bca52824_015800 [Brassica carinata]|uniref:Uncharacterized protein n=1 Tax=Brassica carinata TaxID=52824 RepID=A0A8X8B5Z4_BRACI|nr:hypothetical protein Bca52824_015800 [Brassica carinata]
MVDEKVIFNEVETRDCVRDPFFVGAGSLIPWNALVTAVDYFGYLYVSRQACREDFHRGLHELLGPGSSFNDDLEHKIEL